MSYIRNKTTGEVREVDQNGRPVGQVGPPGDPEFPYAGQKAALGVQTQKANIENDAERLRLARESNALAKASAARDAAREARGAATGTEQENKAASFLVRAFGANSKYEAQKVGARSYIGQKIADTAPDLLNMLPSAVGNSDARQIADASQNEFIAASLRQDSGAAIPEQEMERQRRIYFAMPGEGDATIAAKKDARRRALEGLRASSGKLLAPTIKKYNAGVSARNAARRTPTAGAPRKPNPADAALLKKYGL